MNPWLVFDSGLPRTRTARPSWTKIWIAHHCVQPWQAVETHSPLPGLAALAFLTVSAPLSACARGTPETRTPLLAADALRNSRRFSLIGDTPCADSLHSRA